MVIYSLLIRRISKVKLKRGGIIGLKSNSLKEVNYRSPIQIGGRSFYCAVVSEDKLVPLRSFASMKLKDTLTSWYKSYAKVTGIDRIAESYIPTISCVAESIGCLEFSISRVMYLEGKLKGEIPTIIRFLNDTELSIVASDDASDRLIGMTSLGVIKKLHSSYLDSNVAPCILPFIRLKHDIIRDYVSL